MILAAAWAPNIEKFSSLWPYFQTVLEYIAPSIVACFLMGLFISRLNGTGAIASLLTGLVLGALRLVLELVNGPAKSGLPDSTLWSWIAEINFLHYAVLLFVVCTTVLVVVSFGTRSPAPEQIQGLTYATARGDLRVEKAVLFLIAPK